MSPLPTNCSFTALHTKAPEYSHRLSFPRTCSCFVMRLKLKTNKIMTLFASVYARCAVQKALIARLKRIQPILNDKANILTFQNAKWKSTSDQKLCKSHNFRQNSWSWSIQLSRVPGMSCMILATFCHTEFTLPMHCLGWQCAHVAPCRISGTNFDDGKFGNVSRRFRFAAFLLALALFTLLIELYVQVYSTLAPYNSHSFMQSEWFLYVG